MPRRKPSLPGHSAERSGKIRARAAFDAEGEHEGAILAPGTVFKDAFGVLPEPLLQEVSDALAAYRADSLGDEAARPVDLGRLRRLLEALEEIAREETPEAREIAFRLLSPRDAPGVDLASLLDTPNAALVQSIAAARRDLDADHAVTAEGASEVPGGAAHRLARRLAAAWGEHVGPPTWHNRETEAHPFRDFVAMCFELAGGAHQGHHHAKQAESWWAARGGARGEGSE